MKKPHQYPAAKESFQTSCAKQPFTIGPSFGLSQTQYHTAPTIYNPGHMQRLLYKEASKKQNPLRWLQKQKWYALTSLPAIHCKNCQKKISFDNLNTLDETTQQHLLQNLADNMQDEAYTITQCPYCSSNNVTTKPQSFPAFTPKHQDALVKQVQNLNVFKQLDNKEQLPVCRISLEISDLLKEGSDQIDYQKLANISKLLKKLKNPLVFIHHSTNPVVKPYLFDNKEDIDWFAHLCQEIIKACPTITHVCPINQPMSFALRVPRSMQPPFSTSLQRYEYINNLAEAQKQATLAMKKVRPNIKVLVSHQWKPFSSKHGFFDYRYILEKVASSIAHKMYNHRFIKTFQDQKDLFDGIALSIYPRLHCDGKTIVGDNCSGIIDPIATINIVMQVHETYPDKPIYIVETGCNSTDPEHKKSFVDMTLHVCRIAHDMNIPVKTCFFWGLTNDMNFYREWNKAPGSTNFGFYETLNPDNPISSINPYGNYLKSVISSAY